MQIAYDPRLVHDAVRDELPPLRVVIDGDDAREGVTGHHVRYVLAVSLSLVVAAFIALFAFGVG